MSLANLCSISSASISRCVSTSDSTMGQIRNYTTANRGSLPTTSTGRLEEEGKGNRRFAYEMHDMEVDAKWYTVTDPKCDVQDALTIAGNIYFVQTQRNPDLVGKYFVLDLKFYGRGLQ